MDTTTAAGDMTVYDIVPSNDYLTNQPTHQPAN
jgi:hypothetical protein